MTDEPVAEPTRRNRLSAPAKRLPRRNLSSLDLSLGRNREVGSTCPWVSIVCDVPEKNHALISFKIYKKFLDFFILNLLY